MNYLISTENLKKQGLIHMNTDTKLLTVAIRRSQDMHLQPALGTPLYKELLRRVGANDWANADYVKLMDDYVLPCLVAFVDYRCAMLLNNKITNKGVGRQDDDTMTPNNQAETDEFRNQLRKDAYFYKERLIGYLKDDCGVKYPEYTEAITATNESVRKDNTGYSPLNWIV